jgi:hypothetical protein
VTLGGKADDIKKKLEVNPNTRIPQILFTIYQHVFNSIYILSSNLNTPYPPPDLLHPMAEKIQILASTPQNEPPAEQKEEKPAEPQKTEAPAPAADATPQPAASAEPAPTSTEATPAAPAASSNEPAATPAQPEEKPAEKPAEGT